LVRHGVAITHCSTPEIAASLMKALNQQPQYPVVEPGHPASGHVADEMVQLALDLQRMAACALPDRKIGSLRDAVFHLSKARCSSDIQKRCLQLNTAAFLMRHFSPQWASTLAVDFQAAIETFRHGATRHRADIEVCDTMSGLETGVSSSSLSAGSDSADASLSGTGRCQRFFIGDVEDEPCSSSGGERALRCSDLSSTIGNDPDMDDLEYGKSYECSSALALPPGGAAVFAASDLLFDRHSFGERAMYFSGLALTVGNNSGMNDLMYGKLYGDSSDGDPLVLVHPNMLFDMHITDARAMECSVLMLTIGYDQGLGDIECGDALKIGNNQDLLVVEAGDSRPMPLDDPLASIEAIVSTAFEQFHAGACVL